MGHNFGPAGTEKNNQMVTTVSESSTADGADAVSRPDRANALRALAMDAVQAAASGHPGMPLGMADIAEVLWGDFLRHNPGNPRWTNRDRFVLSNGHGSMLLYGLLHLTGYPLTMEEIKNFRQLGARTAGHPEYEPELGIETTTGPLGQGLANAVGMALAERLLAAEFNKPGLPIVDHHTYVFAGDGCLMEGISHEACSLAGTQKLGKLICLYDDNQISIDGDVAGWFTEDTAARFRAYGWHVISAVDGHDPQSIVNALTEARDETDRPSLICCRTVIGYGAPTKQGKASSHGAPLGADEVEATRAALGWSAPPFEIPAAIAASWDQRGRGADAEAAWERLFAKYRQAHPELAEAYTRRMSGDLPEGWEEDAAKVLAEIVTEANNAATRKSSERALNGFAPLLPGLIGGSADLTGSNNTYHATSQTITPADPGNYLYFGVREFGMAAIQNGLALHGGFIPYGGTFLTFSDYSRNALRMASLMGVGSIFVFTHDSIGLGEDGPTHQPIEQVASLRLMPNMHVWRPCDGVETAVAWRSAVERRNGPTSLVLTRQGLPHQSRTADQVDAIARGGYILFATPSDPEIVLLATGSEVALISDAARQLAEDGVEVRVVALPCVEVFDEQPEAYRDHVLPPSAPRRLAVEAGATGLWWRYVGNQGDVLGIDRYGESAPAGALFEKFGFTTERVLEAARRLLESKGE